MNRHIVVWSVVSALAGFLFGFDTVVISGAERTIQDLWQLSPALHGVAMASALYGTVIGAMGGGWPTDRLQARLFELELQGQLAHLPGGWWQRLVSA